jgi:chromosome segregation ATPase
MPESPEPAGDDLARQLRAEIALVRADAQAARTLAAGADRDVSEVRAELRSHTRVLEALRQTQIEQGRAIDELRRELSGVRGELGGLRGELGGLRGELGELGGDVGGLRGEMRTGFATLASGMADITTLLQRGSGD